MQEHKSKLGYIKARLYLESHCVMFTCIGSRSIEGPLCSTLHKQIGPLVPNYLKSKKLSEGWVIEF